MNDCLLAIDLGSTNLKSVIFDLKGKVISKFTTNTVTDTIETESGNMVFCNHNLLWEKVVEIIKGALKSKDNKYVIKAIAVSGAADDSVPIDKHGNVLYPFISWKCSRTSSQFQWINSQLSNEVIRNVTGINLLPINSICRMMWIKENKPEIYDKTDKWLLMEDFINFKLTNEISADYSLSQSTQLLDISSKQWSKKLFNEVGLEINQMCSLKNSGEIVGQITDEAADLTGLQKGIPVVQGGWDLQCASFACGSFNKGTVVDIIGTWETINISNINLVKNDKLFRYGYNVGFNVLHDYYSYFAYVVCGEMIEWMLNRFCEIDSSIEKNRYELLNNLTHDSKVGSNGIFFLPHMYGSFYPKVDANSRGAYIGLRGNSTLKDIARATIEGLNYQFYNMILGLNGCDIIDIKKIVVAGGATKNKFWMQNKADICGQSIEIADIDEECAQGTALLAGIGVGLYRNKDEAYKAIYRVSNVYEPVLENYNRYQELYVVYEKIYDSLCEINSKIDLRR